MGAFAANYAGIEIICIEGPEGGPLSGLPRRISRCTSLCDTCNVFLWAVDTIQFFTALMCNTMMYGLIIYILSARTINSEQNGCTQESTRIRNQENRDSVARMLSINAIVFFLCLSPYMILNLNSLFREFLGRDFKHVFEWIAKMAYLLNSATNPYIYSGVNKRYRQAFLKVFGFGSNRQETQLQMSFVTGTVSVRSTRGSIRNNATQL